MLYNQTKFILIFLLTHCCVYSQTIVDTELNLKKIDSSFHLFLNLSGNYAKGNVDMFILNSNITLGSRSNKNLYRLTFSNGLTEFFKTRFSDNLNSQFRVNHFITDKSSLFGFAQLGRSLQAKIDSRFLLGVGYRFPLITKDEDYLDFAFGPFYEAEKYPFYQLDNEQYDATTFKAVRMSLNLFSKLKITDNLSSLTTLYTQWKTDEIRDYRIYLNQYLNIKVNDNISFICRYMLRFRSIQYVKLIKNDSNVFFGINVNI